MIVILVYFILILNYRGQFATECSVTASMKWMREWILKHPALVLKFEWVCALQCREFFAHADGNHLRVTEIQCTGGTWNVGTQEWPFKGRNPMPFIHPEGWAQMDILVWGHLHYLYGQRALNPIRHPYRFVVFSISQQTLSLRKMSHVLVQKFQGFHTWSLFRLLCSSKRFVYALLCI